MILPIIGTIHTRAQYWGVLRFLLYIATTYISLFNFIHGFYRCFNSDISAVWSIINIIIVDNPLDSEREMNAISISTATVVSGYLVHFIYLVQWRGRYLFTCIYIYIYIYSLYFS